MAKQDTPRFSFETNIPVELEYGGLLKQGENEYGPWYMVKFKVHGKEYIHFAKEALHKKIAQHAKGTVLSICYREKKNDDGQTYHEWEVAEPFFDDKGKVVEQPKSLMDDENALDEYRKARKSQLFIALVDAAEVAQAFNALSDPDEEGIDRPRYGFLLTREDLRAMAIHLNIDFPKR